jgi:predicted Zn-dependent protease
MMRRAGWDPRGMVELFEILQREARSNPGGVAAFFSSHPSPQDRIGRLQAQIPRNPGGTRDSQQFRAVKARLLRMPAPRAMPRG